MPSLNEKQPVANLSREKVCSVSFTDGKTELVKHTGATECCRFPSKRRESGGCAPSRIILRTVESVLMEGAVEEQEVFCCNEGEGKKDRVTCMW